MRTNLLVAVALGMLPRILPAAPADPCGDTRWQARQQFDGAYLQTRPARVTYASSRGESAHYAIDAAMKYLASCNWPRSQGGSHDLQLGAVLEHHHNSQSQKEAQQTSLGIELSWLMGTPRAELPGNPDQPGAQRHVPLVTFASEFIRDSQANDSAFSAGAFVSLLSNASLLFGRQENHLSPGTSLRLQMLPFVGLERYSSLQLGEDSATADDDLTFTTVKYELTYWPFPHAKQDALAKRVEIVSNAYYRRRLGGFAAYGDSLSLFTASLHYYFDAGERVLLGLDYEIGRKPEQSFESDRLVQLSFKAKLDW